MQTEIFMPIYIYIYNISISFIKLSNHHDAVKLWSPQNVEFILLFYHVVPGFAFVAERQSVRFLVLSETHSEKDQRMHECSTLYLYSLLVI